MYGVKTKRYHTNIKTVIFLYQYIAITRDNDVHEDAMLYLNKTGHDNNFIEFKKIITQTF